MDVKEVAGVLCMNVGETETSYANNSLFQKTIILKTREILEDTIKDLFRNVQPTCFKVADLGCSSGPNTFLTISQVVDIVHEIYRQQSQKLKSFELQVFLNDLPGNDFNAIFRSVPAFLEKLKREKGDFLANCSIAGVSGSFYGRLFPTRSLHLIHSSSSVHWLSKVPKGVENNKWNIYMAKSSPPNVFKAYAKQFQEDFSLFLTMRAEEMKPRGHMFLTLIGRKNPDPSTEFYGWELLAESLSDLVSEGLVKESDLDSFNIPYYAPYEEEVRKIIEEEGSFQLDRLQLVEVDWDFHEEDDINNNDLKLDKYERGKKVANSIRAILENFLASHFGDAIIDRVFARLAIIEAEHLDLDDDEKVVNIVVSMTKK
ncbi:SAM dependent carboxyl methyltransferase [Corchorus olitorius]|uniref:SAM dependent carboxyl methyltransferase n=1 Tax=Corchorus olitorius TaxID=93759 RepID=A0A1R3IPG7_9ROSI|nr:SAM dependent carboxyl methyltransferase [Corchorus olitorius]